MLAKGLNKKDRPFPGKAEHAVNGTRLRDGHLYLAPSDHHLMIDVDERILITKGAQENRSRPRH